MRRIGFLGRMFMCGVIGLLLYLLLPIVQSRAEIAAVPFWQGLKANLQAISKASSRHS